MVDVPVMFALMGKIGLIIHIRKMIQVPHFCLVFSVAMHCSPTMSREIGESACNPPVKNVEMKAKLVVKSNVVFVISNDYTVFGVICCQCRDCLDLLFLQYKVKINLRTSAAFPSPQHCVRSLAARHYSETNFKLHSNASKDNQDM